MGFTVKLQCPKCGYVPELAYPSVCKPRFCGRCGAQLKKKVVLAVKNVS
jgi:succinate dehydrogenase/fumarate reductase-like Fe-S protein